MASQGETWPFQEGLVRAHWQNVRPLQMSQWHQSGRPNQHARHTSWRSWTHLIRFRLGRKPSNRQPRGCQPGTHCGDFSQSCPARYAAVMHYNYQNPMHWLNFPLVIFDKATRDSRGNIPIPTFPQKRDWLGHTVACIIVRRLLISVHKWQSSGMADTHEHWSQHDAHLVYLPIFHGLNLIIFS